MKVTRIAFAILAVSVFAACSADVTGPSSAKPTVANASASATFGTEP